MNDAKTAQASTRRTRGRAHPAEATSPWELALAALGLVLVLGAIGYLTYHAITTQAGPPRIVTTRESIEPNGTGYLVTVKVVNEGTSTAAALQIEGELLRDGRTVELSEATIDYVPRHSAREAGLFFTRDPTRYRLEIRAKGYAEP